MRPDALVIGRHQRRGGRCCAIMDCPVINAGDGIGEHPTQALLDAAAIRQHFGRIEGLKIAICGDLQHSRVARSNAKLLERLGARLRFAAPPSLMPPDLPGGSIDDAVNDADVVMMLRVRLQRGGSRRCPGQYLSRYGLTGALRPLRRRGRGDALKSGGRDRRRAGWPHALVIVRQVEMGVAVRMACLDLLTAERRPSDGAKRWTGASPDTARTSSYHRLASATREIGRFLVAGEARRWPADRRAWAPESRGDRHIALQRTMPGRHLVPCGGDTIARRIGASWTTARLLPFAARGAAALRTVGNDSTGALLPAIAPDARRGGQVAPRHALVHQRLHNGRRGNRFNRATAGTTTGSAWGATGGARR
jgi:hypothetical protein